MNLRDVRKRQNLTQSEASSLLQIPLRTYKRYETKYDNLPCIKKDYLCSKLLEIDQMFKKKQKQGSENYQKQASIVVVGCGYVGLSTACLLSQKNKVTVFDIDASKITSLNNKISPFADKLISKYLRSKKSPTGTLSSPSVYEFADYIIIATPTNFCKKTKSLDTSSIEHVISDIASVRKHANIIIKSTIPFGFCDFISSKYSNFSIFYNPEFLREGRALLDCLYPSRIVIGCKLENKRKANTIANLFINSSKLCKVPFLCTGYKESESIKLFSNAYLALRISFFNELDSFSEIESMETNDIIQGICLDGRIGNFYNNPSFGFGGYCLPKDVAQLENALSSLKCAPLIQSITESNNKRKLFMAAQILEAAKKISKKNESDLTIGVYRLCMKKGSDNFRESPTMDIVDFLINSGIHIIVYEPLQISCSLSDLKSKSDIIVANRYNKELDDVKSKVFTRDIFERD